jgi:hypothetical protein
VELRRFKEVKINNNYFFNVFIKAGMGNYMMIKIYKLQMTMMQLGTKCLQSLLKNLNKFTLNIFPA